MAVQVPIAGSYRINVNGDHREEYTRFASVTTGDTFTSGMKAIFSVQATCGNAAAEVTEAAGVITFNNTGTNYKMIVHGY